MLYRKPCTKSVKHESEVLPTGTGGDGNYMCYDERVRRHSTQGSVVRQKYILGKAKGKTMKGQEEGDMSGNGNRELNEHATVLSITY
jgi:hypothetical protein